jgi:2',3'-cyclic-nucleotide 2'-phosphodiesterase (5'-nucleotidase family)
MLIRYTLLLAFFLSFAFSCSKRATVSSLTLSHQYLANATPDSVANLLLSPYKQRHDSEMTEVVAFSEEALLKGQPEGNLGNFVSECLLERAQEEFKSKDLKIDAVLLNNGGLRVSLPKGEITKGKLFELMPFDNEMMVVEISGKKFYEMLCFIAAKGGMPIAGFRFEINSKKKPINVTIQGIPFDSTASYRVVSSDYLVSGGDNITFFEEGKKFPTHLFIRDILIAHCRRLTSLGKTIDIKTDGRISFSK